MIKSTRFSSFNLILYELTNGVCKRGKFKFALSIGFLSILARRFAMGTPIPLVLFPTYIKCLGTLGLAFKINVKGREACAFKTQ